MAEDKVHNCLECPYINGLNLKWKDPLDEHGGGEFYIQKKHVENLKSRVIIHNTFGVVGSLWDIWRKLIEKVEEVTFFSMHLWQAISDLKASAFLVLSGRYREGYIILRSALDTFMYGNYFQIRNDKERTEEDKADFNIEFMAWQLGKLKCFPSFKEVVNEVNKNTVKDDELVKGIKESYSKLSRIVHTWRESDLERIIEDKVIRPPLHAFSGYYSYEGLNNFYKEFLKVADYITRISRYWLNEIKIEDDVKKELDSIEEIVPTLTQDEPTPVKFTECDLI